MCPSELYASAHKAIRADPLKKRDPLDLGYFGKREKPKDASKKPEKKRHRPGKLSIEQRKARIRQKLTAKGIKSIKSGGGAKTAAAPKKEGKEEKKEKAAPKAEPKKAPKEEGKKDAPKADAAKAEAGKKEKAKKA